MSTYTTTEVRNKIAWEIRWWRKAFHTSPNKWNPVVRADYATRFNTLRMLACSFPKDKVHAITNTDRISA